MRFRGHPGPLIDVLLPRAMRFDIYSRLLLEVVRNANGYCVYELPGAGESTVVAIHR